MPQLIPFYSRIGKTLYDILYSIIYDIFHCLFSYISRELLDNKKLFLFFQKIFTSKCFIVVDYLSNRYSGFLRFIAQIYLGLLLVI